METKGDLGIRVENPLARPVRALHPGVQAASMILIGGRIMKVQRRPVHLGGQRALLMAVVLAAPAWVRGAEPLETIREAFRTWSQGLTSGIGKGTYRHDRAIGEGDWQLDRDADVATYFDGEKYHIEFVYHRDEVLNEHARRIISDGRIILAFALTPDGEGRFQFKPEDERAAP
jgi:hypothetical protein